MSTGRYLTKAIPGIPAVVLITVSMLLFTHNVSQRPRVAAPPTATPRAFSPLVIASPKAGALVVGPSAEISGTGYPGSNIVVQLPHQVYRHTAVDSSGRWKIALALLQGNHEIRVRQEADPWWHVTTLRFAYKHSPSRSATEPQSRSNSQPEPDQVLVAAGDIASCTSTGDEATAKLLQRIPGTIATLGDNAYPNGTASDFANCYGPTWGRFKARIRPVPGNHEYHTRDARDYFDYFGAAAGPHGKGYYSYDLGRWHIVAINSNCSAIGGCDEGSPQVQWLRVDLAINQRSCILAYSHQPLVSSGYFGGTDTSMYPIWQALDDYGTDVVLSGHDHYYKRFAPMDPSGEKDEGGIRQFVVGTGGGETEKVAERLRYLEVHNDDTFGVLKLTLRATGYNWKFVPVAGKHFTDSGSDSCSR